MIVFTYLVILISLSLNADNSKPPNLDLRNFNLTIDDIKLNSLNSLIPDYKNNNNILLFDHQIAAIKLKSSQYVPEPVNNNDKIFMYTNYGLIEFSFFLKDSPNHCLNFKKLSNSKFYDQTLFHYVIPNFIIQGGDILTRNENKYDDGQGGPGWTIDAEFNELKHVEGTLSMFRTQNDPNSAGSQFFISLSENKGLDNNYTAFASIVKGMHVLLRLSNVPSENRQAKLLCEKSIPSGEDESDWVELWDPIQEMNLFSKKQADFKKNEYKEVMQERLDNMFNPAIPIIIDSIRVRNEK